MIALFPGHVGKDSGAVGITDDGFHYVESAVNLAITNKAGSLMTTMGIDHKVVTGNFDSRIDGSKGCSLGISVHADTFSDSSVFGAHVSYYQDSPKGLVLANYTTGALHTVGRKIHSYPKPRTDLAILKRTAFPCILLEVGYLTNSKESRDLHKISTQWRIAHAIIEGVLRYENEIRV